jgi:hypothetical protein
MEVTEEDGLMNVGLILFLDSWRLTVYPAVSLASENVRF